MSKSVGKKIVEGIDFSKIKDISNVQYLFVFDFGDRKEVSSGKTVTSIGVTVPKYVKSKKKWVFKVEVFEK